MPEGCRKHDCRVYRPPLAGRRPNYPDLMLRRALASCTARNHAQAMPSWCALPTALTKCPWSWACHRWGRLSVREMLGVRCGARCAV